MNRRALLASVGVVGSGALATAFATSKGTPTPTASDLVPLEYVLVENASDEADGFDLTVVREGEVVYQGQLDLQPGESARVDGWEPKARSFAIFGKSDTFSNYEVVALDSKGEFTRSYRAEFVIQPSGDVRGGAANLEEATS